ncbi:hypothetical protein [Brachyspira pulli]|uniref:hypothetical protein n=1 Tax=Brachyspira pulli TaxID=310721 RepID=UPI00300579C4
MLQKIFILILSIILISCKSPYKNENDKKPDRVIAIDGSGGVDITKANVGISTSSSSKLPIRIFIKDSTGTEIPIGQLTVADGKNGTYYKVFAFAPGTYTLIIRSENSYYPEKKYENLSFSAGSLEEYQY